ncbi:MAG: ABC transporter ATP-binding protein, partial [Gemmataceae bacterium]
PEAGRVTVGGHDARSTAARRLVGYCPDVDAFYEEMSGRQFVEAMARLCGYTRAEARRRAGAALERVGMDRRAERTLRGYSKGMRQRIKLAQALLHDPPLLVLDEPMSGIDPVGRAEFVTLFKELAAQGKCLLISSHELDELEKLTDHVVIMSNGRVAAADTVSRIRERLVEVPMTVRIDVKRGDGGRDHRTLAALLLQAVPDLSGVELSEPAEGVGRLLVRVRSPRRFLTEVSRLVLEEWYEVIHLRPVDESTQAVLGMLLASRR